MRTIFTQLNYTSHEYKNELRKTNLCLLRGAESFLLSVHDKDTEETPIHFVPGRLNYDGEKSCMPSSLYAIQSLLRFYIIFGSSNKQCTAAMAGGVHILIIPTENRGEHPQRNSIKKWFKKNLRASKEATNYYWGMVFCLQPRRKTFNCVCRLGMHTIIYFTSNNGPLHSRNKM